MLPPADDPRGDRRPAPPHRPDPRRDLQAADAVQRVLVARHPERPIRSTTSTGCSPNSSSCTATGASPTTPPSSRYRRAIKGAGPGRRAPEGPRHQAEGPPQLRLRTARGISQGAAGDADGRQVRPADHLLRRHAGGLSRHRVGGARHGRGHRPQPARDGHPRRADHRRRHRRGRQRRRARPGGRRPRADAGVRRLQRHSARGLRRHPVARRRPEDRGRGGVEDHRARSDRARHRRRHHRRTAGRRPPGPGHRRRQRRSGGRRRAGGGRRVRRPDAIAGALRALPAAGRAGRRDRRHGGALGAAPTRAEA